MENLKTPEQMEKDMQLSDKELNNLFNAEYYRNLRADDEYEYNSDVELSDFEL